MLFKLDIATEPALVITDMAIEAQGSDHVILEMKMRILRTASIS